MPAAKLKRHSTSRTIMRNLTKFRAGGAPPATDRYSTPRTGAVEIRCGRSLVEDQNRLDALTRMTVGYSGIDAFEGVGPDHFLHRQLALSMEADQFG